MGPTTTETKSGEILIKMKPLGFFKHLFCYVTLGLFSGWYFILMFLMPSLIYLSVIGNFIARVVLAIFVVITFIPINHKPWKAFMNSFLFEWWGDYFDITYDFSSSSLPPSSSADTTSISGSSSSSSSLSSTSSSSLSSSEVSSAVSSSPLIKGQKYMFLEFPHGILPMGQILSVRLIEQLAPGQMICGTGADAIFKFPVMRHFMSWIGVHPANRKTISNMYKNGYQVAVIPGGIAEMFLMNELTEHVYFLKRQNTIKAAIQEGVHIIPLFFFGNTKIFKTVGNSGKDKDLSESFLEKISRKLRASVVLFYGRHYLPVPFRHPIKMVSGQQVIVKQMDNPSDEYIHEIQQQVIQSLQKVYQEKKPLWETRPLLIT